MFDNTFRYRWWHAVGAALVAAFVGGWVSAGTQFATSVNKGLATALNAVGQNLFGSAVFNVIPPDPKIPQEPIRLFLASDSRIPVAFDVFSPPAPILPQDPVVPCRVVAQLSVGANGVQLAYDSDTFPDGITVDDSANLAQLRPNVARCPAVLPPGQDP
jgi:hypothetical protein